MVTLGELPASIFAAPRDWSAAGFTRLEGRATLYSNSKWPGLLFKRVASVSEAFLFGGVIVGDHEREILLCSKQPGVLSRWACGVAVTSAEADPSRAPFYVRGDKLGWYTAEFSPITSKAGGEGGDPIVMEIDPTYGMAVVSNCSALGFRSKTQAVSAQYFDGGIYNSAGALSTNVDGGVGAVNATLPPLQQYLVQWLELPFAQDGGAFVKAAVPAIAGTYPSEVASGFAKVLNNVADDPGFNPAGPSTFVLSRVTAGAAEIWGGIVTARYSGPFVYETYGGTNAAASEGPAPASLKRTCEGIEGGFFDENMRCLRVPGELTVAGGFTITDMPAQLTVASNFVLDMAKVLPEFGPLAPQPTLSGQRNYSELVTGSPLRAGGSSSEIEAMGNRPKRNRLVAALGKRSVEVDLVNLMIRAEAIAMDERLYASNTGTAFSDASGAPERPDPTAQSSGYLYTAAVAQQRGGKLNAYVGALVYETAGTFTPPVSGRYIVTFLGNGTTLKGDKSAHGAMSVRSAFLSAGVAYKVRKNYLPPINVIGTGEVTDQGYVELNGPNFVWSVITKDVGVDGDPQATVNNGPPSHGIIGSNGVPFGRKQSVANGPTGRWAVVIQLESVDE